ncbi:MAG: hypothetical protein HYX84_05395 [Chloroflexi bacterium]|nr:hypothetical protein [Chloroflexota bacterium]
MIEGILEGAREGASQGIKKAGKEAFRDILAGDLGGGGDIDLALMLEEVSENAVRVSVRESSKNVFSGPAEAYVRSVCDRIIDQLKQRNASLSGEEISHLTGLLRQAHQRAIRDIGGRLPDNPFVRELFEGLQVALEDALDKELKSFEERLTHAGG